MVYDQTGREFQLRPAVVRRYLRRIYKRKHFDCGLRSSLLSVFVAYTGYFVVVDLVYQTHRSTSTGYYLLDTLFLALKSMTKDMEFVNSVFVQRDAQLDVAKTLAVKARVAGMRVDTLQYSTNVSIPSGKPEMDELGDSIKQEHLGDCPDYVHSLERDDVFERSVEGFSVYMEPEREKHLTLDDYMVMLVDIVVNLMPRNDDDDSIHFEVPDPFDMAMYQPTQASTGFIYGKRISCLGSKKENYFEIGRSLHEMKKECILRIPQPIPYRSVIKPEVVKKEKKNRAIQVASATYQVIGFNCVLPAFRMIGNYFLGHYLGLPITEGGIERCVNDMRMKKQHFCSDNCVNTDVYCECDKKRWEGTADPYTAELLKFHWLSLTDFHQHPPVNSVYNCFRAFWRDYENPYFPLGGNTFYTRKGVVPSGTSITADGNGLRQIYSRRSFMWFVRHHNYVSDGCDVCRHLGPFQTSEHELTVDQYCSAVMSDDFFGYRTSISKLCVKYVDYMFGHETEYEETRTPEFLRIQLRGGLFYREPIRVLSKIRHGSDSVSNIMLSCISAAFMSANNKQLYEKLSDLYNACRVHVLQPLVLDDWKTSLEGIFDTFPTYDEVCSFQKYGPKTARHHKHGLTLGLVNMVSHDFKSNYLDV